MTAADASLLARVRSASGDHLRAAADAVLTRPWGWAVRTPSLPAWRDLNMVVLDGDTAALPDGAVPGLCAQVLADLPPVAEVWEPDSPERLAPAGWARDPFALLVHAPAVRRAPAGPRGTRTARADARRGGRRPWQAPGRGPVALVTGQQAVHEVPRETVAGLRRRWLAEEGMPAAAIEVAARAEARMFTRTPTRAFAIVHGGAPVACALLVGTGRTRMVEHVYVLPPARGRGLAGALVRTAVAAAYADGADLVWLATDDGGPAMRVYEREGFRRVTGATRLVAP